MPTDDCRLIEDYIPIEAISTEARREKSIRKGHISTLHLWWARRPLVAARAAVYGALVHAPEDRGVKKEAADCVAMRRGVSDPRGQNATVRVPIYPGRALSARPAEQGL
jgi:adenine-specific DNA methylase